MLVTAVASVADVVTRAAPGASTSGEEPLSALVPFLLILAAVLAASWRELRDR